MYWCLFFSFFPLVLVSNNFNRSCKFAKRPTLVVSVGCLYLCRFICRSYYYLHWWQYFMASLSQLPSQLILLVFLDAIIFLYVVLFIPVCKRKYFCMNVTLASAFWYHSLLGIFFSKITGSGIYLLFAGCCKKYYTCYCFHQCNYISYVCPRNLEDCLWMQQNIVQLFDVSPESFT